MVEVEVQVHSAQLGSVQWGRRVRANISDVCRPDRTDHVVYKPAGGASRRVQQFKKTLFNATFGVGSEFIIDVAPGIGWTTILAICIGLHQVRKHYAKDAFNNFIVEPVKGHAMNMAMDEATAAYQEVVGEEEVLEGEEAEGEESKVEKEGKEGSILGQIFEIISSIFEEQYGLPSLQ